MDTVIKLNLLMSWASLRQRENCLDVQIVYVYFGYGQWAHGARDRLVAKQEGWGMRVEELQPEQVRQCRAGLRLSQPKFGERIGVGRISVYQYEHGRRHDTQQSIAISQTVNMACGATWLGISGYTAVLAAAKKADALSRNDIPMLPGNSIEPWHQKEAEEELISRGIELYDYRLAFPLFITLTIWSQIQQWASERGYELPRIHPVVSTRVPGVAILDFEKKDAAAAFKMFLVTASD